MFLYIWLLNIGCVRMLSFKLSFCVTVTLNSWMEAQGHAFCKVYVCLDVAVKN